MYLRALFFACDLALFAQQLPKAASGGASIAIKRAYRNDSALKSEFSDGMYMKNQWLMQTLPLRLGIVPALLPCIGPATAASGTAQTAS